MIHLYAESKKLNLNIKIQTSVKVQKKIHDANNNNNKVGMAMLISNRVNVRTRSIARD